MKKSELNDFIRSETFAAFPPNLLFFGYFVFQEEPTTNLIGMVMDFRTAGLTGLQIAECMDDSGWLPVIERISTTDNF